MVAAPGSLTLEQEIQQLKKRVDDLGRVPDVYPVCRVRFYGTASLPAGDTLAQGGWGAVEDPQGMFKLDGTYSRVLIPVTGYYAVHLHCAMLGPTSGYTVSRILLNSKTISAGIASDQCPYPSGGGDGSLTDALRIRVPLNAGDSLYWVTYTSAAATLQGITNGTPTELAVTYLNARSG
jgi:hypothetical protein